MGSPKNPRIFWKAAKRRQWRMKRAGFEEVPRLAGMKCPGIGWHNGVGENEQRNGADVPLPTQGHEAEWSL
jgi:hypothetical protein